jgi:hypothetical protein
MVVLDDSFALGCGSETEYPLIHIFHCMLERTDGITKEVLEPVTFVLAYAAVRECINLAQSIDQRPFTVPETVLILMIFLLQ